MWLALRAAPLQTSAILPMFPRKRGKESRLMPRALPSPAKRGKVPTAGAWSACEQRSWPEGRAPGWRESGGWGQAGARGLQIAPEL